MVPSHEGSPWKCIAYSYMDSLYPPLVQYMSSNVPWAFNDQESCPGTVLHLLHLAGKGPVICILLLFLSLFTPFILRTTLRWCFGNTCL